MDDKKRLNLVDIDATTHGWIVQEANRQGMKIGEFAGIILDQACILWTPPEDDENSRRRLFWNWVEVKRLHAARERVYDAARIYLELGTEELADRLASMCEDAGMDYKEVMNIVGNDPFSSIIVASRDGSKFGQCMKWLLNLLMDSGGEVAVREIHSRGAETGFSNAMIGRVKRAICDDAETPSIVSVRVSEGWNWRVDGVGVSVMGEEEQQ